jgi:hypothetical protein
VFSVKITPSNREEIPARTSHGRVRPAMQIMQATAFSGAEFSAPRRSHASIVLFLSWLCERGK